MNYIIVIILPDPSRKIIQKIQAENKHPDWKITLPPHITIVPPFSLPKEKTPENVIAVVKNSIKTLNQFDIETNGIKKFDNKVSTIYLSAILSVELSELYSKIDAAVSPIINEILDYPKDYIPHVTLSGDIPSPLSGEYYSKMSSLNIGGKFSCTKINLFKKSPEDKNWIPLEIFNLQ